MGERKTVRRRQVLSDPTIRRTPRPRSIELSEAEEMELLRKTTGLTEEDLWDMGYEG